MKFAMSIDIWNYIIVCFPISLLDELKICIYHSEVKIVKGISMMLCFNILEIVYD